ncbi:DUF4232 domain-containing protein [Streptomyces sp. NPDC003717]|uniref:DUF4232 domain-containing protein n=1 Tax=Streptomyces sp. NPDC003717 TaxID=3154276 RepID=UPI0033A25AB6
MRPVRRSPSGGDHSVHADTLSPSDEPRTSGASGAPGTSGGPCDVAYTVTNPGTESFTYTITFSPLDEQDRAMSGPMTAVVTVGAGQTAHRTFDGSGLHAHGRVKVQDVEKVPTAEAPAPAGTCPRSGLRVTADDGDAAMGLRVVGLHLENCGSEPYSLEGYPALRLLDEDRAPVEGVAIRHGKTGETESHEADQPPRPVTLAPGESAVAGLTWRNTTGFGEPVNVPYVQVRAVPGADPVMVAPHLDLGTTGKLVVSPWRAEPPASSGRP